MHALLPESAIEARDRILSKLMLAAGVALLAAACTTQPADPAASAAGGIDNAVASAEDVECRTMQVTGSNLPRRVCRSKRVWDAISGTERRTADEYGRQTRENSTIVEEGSQRGLPTAL